MRKIAGLGVVLLACSVDDRAVRIDSADGRAGSHAPIGTCAALAGKEFRVQRTLTELSQDRESETPLGIARNGDVLYQRTNADCSKLELRMALNEPNGYREGIIAQLSALDSPQVTPAHLSQISFSGVAWAPAAGALFFARASDGSWQGDGFATARVLVDFSVSALDESHFEIVNRDIVNKAGHACCPVISGDGLTFVYSLMQDKDTAIMQARRDRVGDAFAASQVLRGDLDALSDLVSSLSYDGLTAFVVRNNQTHVFTRTSLTDEFRLSNIPPLQLPLVQASEDCATLIGASGLGCSASDLVVAVPQ